MDAAAQLTAPLVRALKTPWIALGAGIALAGAAAVAAPSNALLPGPVGAAHTLLAAAVLAAVFACGYLRPLYALYGLVVLVVLEGAIRKWAINDVTVFLAKDFLALGIYAAVLPRLSRADLRRPWWLLAPLAGIVLLALVSSARSPSLSQAVVGLRSYMIYLPLLWVAPALLTTRARVYAVAGLVLGLAAANGVFAVAQALSGASVLNKLVSGALAGLITLRGVAYIRPSGTFMQVGVLAAFLFFGVLVAFALVFAERRGRWLSAALGAFGFITWGVVYSSARSLVGSILLAYILLVAAVLWRRRLVAVLIVPAVFAISVVALFDAVPWVQKEGTAVAHAIERHSWKWVTIHLPPPQHALRLRVPPNVARGLSERIRTAKAEFTITGADSGGNVLIVTIRPHAGAVQASAPVTTVLGVDKTGHLIRVGVGSPHAGSAGSFLGRAADFNTAGGQVGLWGSRIKPQLTLIAHQRIVGHGTGTMTLGSGYADSGPTILNGEGMYSKFAWELGWLGLVLFLWLIGALVALSVLAAVRARGWRRLPSFIAASAALILPIWYLFTFALDFPVVAILFWMFVGLAMGFTDGAGPDPMGAEDHRRRPNVAREAEIPA